MAACLGMNFILFCARWRAAKVEDVSHLKFMQAYFSDMIETPDGLCFMVEASCKLHGATSAGLFCTQL